MCITSINVLYLCTVYNGVFQAVSLYFSYLCYPCTFDPLNKSLITNSIQFPYNKMSFLMMKLSPIQNFVYIEVDQKRKSTRSGKSYASRIQSSQICTNDKDIKKSNHRSKLHDL